MLEWTRPDWRNWRLYIGASRAPLLQFSPQASSQSSSVSENDLAGVSFSADAKLEPYCGDFIASFLHHFILLGVLAHCTIFFSLVRHGGGCCLGLTLLVHALWFFTCIHARS